MDGRLADDAIYLEGDARRFHTASGIGRPIDGGLVVSWIEAAFLLERGDIDSIDGRSFVSFLTTAPDRFALERFFAYRDLRHRGYYVATAYEPGVVPPVDEPTLLVKPRGAPPTGDAVEYRIAVVTETLPITAREIEPSTLAIVDDEAEITYLNIEADGPVESTRSIDLPPVTGTMVGDRVVVADPPEGLYKQHFFGRTLDGSDHDAILMNLLEATFLRELGVLNVAESSRLLDKHDDRYRVYSALRQGAVPRSGLKFGTDFRVYDSFDSTDNPGHSDRLVTVVDSADIFTPRELSKAVRLANGVRKDMIYVIVDEVDLQWRRVSRLTP